MYDRRLIGQGGMMQRVRFGLGGFTLALLLFGCAPLGVDAVSQTAVSAEGLQAALDDAVFLDDIPGATAAVLSPGVALWVGASGVANVDTQTPMHPHSYFRIASVTKPFVAAAVLSLVAEGHIGLEDTLSQHLSASLTQWVPFAQRITLRQLLNHTSGIFDYLESERFLNEIEQHPQRVWQEADVLPYAADGAPRFRPGEAGRWEYSNTNYILLGLVIEAVMNSGWDMQVRERVFEPLALTDSFVEVKETIPQTLVRGYEDGARSFADVTDINTGNGLADGGIVSTAADLVRFAQGVFQGGLLDINLQSAMLEFVSIDSVGEGYGLGVSQAQSRFGEVWGHSGSILGYGSVLWYLPNENVFVAVLANHDAADVAFIAESLLEVLLN